MKTNEKLNLQNLFQTSIQSANFDKNLISKQIIQT